MTGCDDWWRRVGPGSRLGCQCVSDQLQAVHGDALPKWSIQAEEVFLVVGGDVGVGVEVVRVSDDVECNGDRLSCEHSSECLHMLNEGWRAGEGVGVRAGGEWHVDGVEDERHVQPGVGGATAGWQCGVVVDDAIRHKGGEAAALWWGAGGRGAGSSSSVTSELCGWRSGPSCKGQWRIGRARWRRQWGARQGCCG